MSFSPISLFSFDLGENPFPDLSELFDIPEFDIPKIEESETSPSFATKRAETMHRCQRIRERIEEIRAQNPTLEPKEVLSTLRQDPEFADCQKQRLRYQVKAVYGRNITEIKQPPMSAEEKKSMTEAIKSIIAQRTQVGLPLAQGRIIKQLKEEFHCTRSAKTMRKRILAVLEGKECEQRYRRLSLGEKEAVKHYLSSLTNEQLSCSLFAIREDLVQKHLLPPYSGPADYFNFLNDVVNEERGATVRELQARQYAHIKAHLTTFLTGPNRRCSYARMGEELFKQGVIPHEDFHKEKIKCIAKEVLEELPDLGF